MNHDQPAHVPLTACLIGLTGLIPFIAPAIVALAGNPTWVSAQHSYAACILAFLGALHWGPALNGSAQRPILLLTWGVIPSLIGWLALQQLYAMRAMVLVIGLCVTFAADIWLARFHRWPAYFLKLRAVLSAIACIGLLLASLN
jgi:hypothetical protein